MKQFLASFKKLLSMTIRSESFFFYLVLVILLYTVSVWSYRLYCPQIHPQNMSVKDGPHALQIIYVHEFTEKSADEFISQLDELQEAPQQVIPVIIESHGGFTTSFLRMAAAIKLSKKPVATTCANYCESSAAFLLMMGTEGYRYSSDHAKITLHIPETMVEGTVEELSQMMISINIISESAFGMVSDNTHHCPGYFLTLLEGYGRINWTIPPQTAKELNVINHIGLLVLTWDSQTNMYKVK